MAIVPLMSMQKISVTFNAPYTDERVRQSRLTVESAATGMNFALVDTHTTGSIMTTIYEGPSEKVEKFRKSALGKLDADKNLLRPKFVTFTPLPPA